MVVKKLPARFYRNASGHEPVREWLKHLTQSERQVVDKDIKKVEFGWPLDCLSAALSAKVCGKFVANCRHGVSPGRSSVSRRVR